MEQSRERAVIPPALTQEGNEVPRAFAFPACPDEGRAFCAGPGRSEGSAFRPLRASLLPCLPRPSRRAQFVTANRARELSSRAESRALLHFPLALTKEGRFVRARGAARDLLFGPSLPPCLLASLLLCLSSPRPIWPEQPSSLARIYLWPVARVVSGFPQRVWPWSNRPMVPKWPLRVLTNHRSRRLYLQGPVIRPRKGL